MSTAAVASGPPMPSVTPRATGTKHRRPSHRTVYPTSVPSPPHTTTFPSPQAPGPTISPQINLNPKAFDLPASLPLLTSLSAWATMPSMAALHFIGLCLAWYAASATASNVGKHLLTLWDQPVTASWIQFLFTSMYAFLSAKVFRITTLQPPSRRVFAVVVPLCAFQVGSHVLTSIAISRVPVSFVHTVKALSPLFTVLAYRLLFSVTYPPRVYTAMIPLTLGVMLACAKALDVQFVGVLCALGSCIIYVAQNIFSKRVLFRDEGVTPNSAAPPRMDKINLLFWSSISAFIVMTPGWLWSEGFSLLFSSSSHSIGFSHIFFLLMLNGTAHFAQALLAITVLSTSSPVTYSIASLMKRVVVITCAVLWFRQPIGLTQACGITMTFYGLWLYDRAKGDVRRGERIVERRYGELGFRLPR